MKAINKVARDIRSCEESKSKYELLVLYMKIYNHYGDCTYAKVAHMADAISKMVDGEVQHRIEFFKGIIERHGI